MKIRIISVMLAVLFMFPLFGVAAYAAAPEDITETQTITGDVDDPAEEPDADAEDTTAIDIDFGDMSDLLSLFMLMGTMGNNATDTELSALPPGSASVINYNTDPDGRLFYTIMTPDEHVFYLVIDKTSNTNNVYFLNAVTVDDLLPLAANPKPQQGGTVTPPPTVTEPPEETNPAPEPSGGNNMGMIILLAVLAVVGGGAGWYFKIYRPKQQKVDSDDDYNEYEPDPYGGDEQEPEPEDDGAPWYDDEETSDNDSGDGGDE